MTETAAWQFEVEVHPPSWIFPRGKTWVAGWIWLKENRVTADLRAWVDGRPYLALHGLPQPGRDEIFLGRAGPPYAGFVLLLEPHAGASLLRLEVRDETGAWREFFRAPITVAESGSSFPPQPALPALLENHFDALLRRRAGQPATPWAALADETISTALAEPLNSLPNPPFFGALEEPREIGWVRYGRISVTGWLAHRTARITQLTAMIDPLFEVSLLHGLKRDDIEGVFADLPGKETSAFLGHVDLPASSSTPALLKIFAQLDTGEKHLVFAQRFTPRVMAGANAPLPVLSKKTFAAAAWALWRSAKRHHLPPTTWAAVKPALNSAWENYSAEAPAKPATVRPEAIPAIQAEPGKPLRTLIVTHNLNFEGAPWFIYELACYLAAQPGASVRIASPQDGPLRAVFEKAGLPVQIVDIGPAVGARTTEEFKTKLIENTATLPWAEIDLVIGNTMVTFWAVHAARQAGKPSLLYVHESSPVRRFFARSLAPALLSVVEDAFTLAHRVIYTAAATQVVHARLGHGVLLPSWVDVARVDHFVENSTALALRKKHGLDPTATLLVNIGSLCERKGQHVFIQAAELLKEELHFTYPQEKIQFVMVGARPGLYLEMLKEEVTRLGLQENVVFVAETGEIFDFYRLADIFVCTSFEESFPRVLLESAAFNLPIVSTNVNGIAEMLTDEEAWLTPPGDRYRLADAIKKALGAHFGGDHTRRDLARIAIERKYHQDNSMPQHLAVAQAATKSHR
ncbi:glycosyltransferase family 4 protein [Oleiharenicola lentus]|uniref:glycosyltransferase family 4 protein n=1 Tax=Oleiharenicola lentus TaxID=2508720 RepID=UPI003F672D21